MKQDTMLIFDLDGTLWDSAPAVAEAWNEVFREADANLPPLTTEDVHGVMGMTMAEIGRVLQPQLAPEKREAVWMNTTGFGETISISNTGPCPRGWAPAAVTLQEATI